MSKQMDIVRATQPSLVPEIVARAAKQTPALRNRPAWLKPQSAERIERILAAHHAAEQGFKTFAVGVVLAGSELTILRREAGPGRWSDVLTMYLEPAGISERHVERYIGVATSAVKKHRVDVAALMESPNSVDGEVWARLSEHITAVTNATTWRGLIDGLGMAKRETRGGYRPDADLLAEYGCLRGMPADWDDWTQEQQEAFRAWAKTRRREGAGEDRESRSRRRAVENWVPIIGILESAYEGATALAGLPKEHLARLRNVCHGLTTKIDAMLR